MGITVRDTANSTPTGQAGRGNSAFIITNVWYSQPSGSRLLIWDVTDPDNIVLATTFDLTSPTSFDPMTYTAVSQAVGCKVNSGNQGSIGNVDNWGVVNYDPAGNCYLASYDMTLDGNGVPTSLVQLGNVLLGTNAPNTLINQGGEIFGPGQVCLYPFGDDIHGVSSSSSTVTDVGQVTIATTPGNQAHGVCVNDYATEETIFYATGRFDGIIRAFEVNVTFPAVTELWTTSTAAPEARNCYRSLSTDTVQVVAVVTIDGAQSFVELFNPTTGAALGIYENTLGGTIQDVFLRDTCMFVFTDGVADNIQTVNISNVNAPVFSASSTVSGYGFLASKTSTIGVDETAFVVSGNLTSTGEAGIAVISLGATCPAGSPPGGSTLALYALGSRLYVGDDTPQLEVFDISNPAAPSSLGTLALTDDPTDIWVNESNCYIAFHGGFYVVNIDSPATMTITKRVETGDNFDYICAPGGYVYASGAAARLTAYNPGNSPPSLLGEREIISGGVSAVAVEGQRVFFADVAPTGAAVLYSYGVGGYSCHAIAAGVLSADEVKAEEIYARHGHFKGDIAARSLLLTERLAATGIVLVDSVDGSLHLVTVASGTLTTTPL